MVSLFKLKDTAIGELYAYCFKLIISKETNLLTMICIKDNKRFKVSMQFSYEHKLSYFINLKYLESDIAYYRNFFVRSMKLLYLNLYNIKYKLIDCSYLFTNCCSLKYLQLNSIKFHVNEPKFLNCYNLICIKTKYKINYSKKYKMKLIYSPILKSYIY